MSVTSGVVSRIEVTSYTHGATALLGMQIDAGRLLLLCRLSVISRKSLKPVEGLRAADEGHLG